jgi:hypothetical protein
MVAVGAAIIPCRGFNLRDQQLKLFVPSHLPPRTAVWHHHFYSIIIFFFLHGYLATPLPLTLLQAF